MHPKRQRFVTAACVILITLCAVDAQTSAPQGTASVTGRVTLDGRALANTQVLLAASPKETDNFLQSLMESNEARKTTTDSEGRFRFNEVAAGAYQVKVFAPTLVADKSESGVRVSEGETVDGVDFALKTGGVITGAVTLPDGRPAIRETVHISASAPPKPTRPVSPDKVAPEAWRPGPSATTDDRGVYRIYGIAPGDYIVSVNHGGGKKESVQTYYPGADDKAKAVPVKVKAGSETSGIDFKLGLSRKKGFEVRGRVIDESGKPLSGLMVSCTPAHEGSEGEKALPSIGASVPEMTHSNAAGEFKIQGVTPGKYSASVMSMFDEASVYGDPATFEVANRDIDGIEIKTHKGLTASGTAVIEGTDDPAIVAQLTQVQLMGVVTKGAQFNFSVSKANLGPDGNFVMKGLSPGKLNLVVNPLAANNPFSILRVERGGAPQKEGVEITPDSPVTDIKLVLGYGNCTIYGRTSVEGGTLPKCSALYVHIQRVSAGAPQSDQFDMSLAFGGAARSGTMRTIEIAPGGDFRAEGLVPGDYEVTLTTSRYGARPPPADNDDDDDDESASASSSARQKVTLTSGAQLEVNLKLDLSSHK